ncbi:Hemolymph lipopolysaccharide-binding protein [Blattella germanica]|nr:Hemolymph lipopolysaccharide-binding protein [Blattella germanica]
MRASVVICGAVIRDPNTGTTSPNDTAPKRHPKFIGSYRFFPGVGFYKFYKFKVPWGDAWAQCRDDNAHLVVIDSEKELEVVKLLQIQAKSKDWCHIGVHDLYLNTRYITVLDEEFTPSSFNKWNQNEPTNNAAENCVGVLPTGFLGDLGCGTALPFICEYEVPEIS